MINLQELSLEELKELQRDIAKEIARREEQENKKIVYLHNCHAASNYHLRKYKHWAKRVTAIDDKYLDGRAFLGDFLNVQRENMIPVNSIVVEVCGDTYYAYIAQEESKKLIAKGQRGYLSDFIKKIKKVLDYFPES